MSLYDKKWCKLEVLFHIRCRLMTDSVFSNKPKLIPQKQEKIVGKEGGKESLLLFHTFLTCFMVLLICISFKEIIYLYCCSGTVISIFPPPDPQPQPSPPPTLNPTLFWLCPCVLHTCSWTTLPPFNIYQKDM